MASTLLVQHAMGLVIEEGKTIVAEYVCSDEDEERAIQTVWHGVYTRIMTPSRHMAPVCTTAAGAGVLIRRLFEWRCERARGAGGVQVKDLPRVEAGTDLVFYLCLLCALRQCPASVLSSFEPGCVDFLLQHITSKVSGPSPTKEPARRIFDMQLETIALLGPCHGKLLANIHHALVSGLSETKAPDKTEREVLLQVRLLRHVRSNGPGVDPLLVCRLVAPIAEWATRLHGKGDLKQVLCEALTSLLLPIHTVTWFSETLADVVLQEQLLTLHNPIERWAQRSKHTPYALPAACSVLVSTNMSRGTLPTFIESVMDKFSKEKKSASSRQLYLECALHVLGAHVTYTAPQPNSATKNVPLPVSPMGSPLSDNLRGEGSEDDAVAFSKFDTGSTTPLGNNGWSEEVNLCCQSLVKGCRTVPVGINGPHIVAAIDMALLILRVDVRRGVQLLDELLTDPPTSSSGDITEGALIALHCLLLLASAAQPCLDTTIPAPWWVLGPPPKTRSPYSSYITPLPLAPLSAYTHTQYSNHTQYERSTTPVMHIRRGPLVSMEGIQGALVAHADTFSKILSQYLIYCEREVLNRAAVNAKTGPTTEKDRTVLNVFRLCLLLTPYLRPSTYSPTELCGLFARVWLQGNPDLCGALRCDVFPFFVSERTLREPLLTTLCMKSGIYHLEDPDSLLGVIRLLRSLVHAWTTLTHPHSFHCGTLKSEAITVSSFSPGDCVEGLCLALLCTTHLELRQEVINLLQSVADVWNELHSASSRVSLPLTGGVSVHELLEMAYDEVPEDMQSSLHGHLSDEHRGVLRCFLHSPTMKQQSPSTAPNLSVSHFLLASRRVDGVLRALGTYVAVHCPGPSRAAFLVLRQWCDKLSPNALRVVNSFKEDEKGKESNHHTDSGSDTVTVMVQRWLNVVSLGSPFLRRDADSRPAEWLTLLSQMLKCHVVDVIDSAVCALGKVPLLFGTGVLELLRVTLDELVRGSKKEKEKDRRRNLLVMWHCILRVCSLLLCRLRKDVDQDTGADICRGVGTLLLEAKDFVLAIPEDNKEEALALRVRAHLCDGVRWLYIAPHHQFTPSSARSQRCQWLKYISTLGYRYESVDLALSASDAITVLLSPSLFAEGNEGIAETDRPFNTQQFLSWVHTTLVKHKERQAMAQHVLSRVIACTAEALPTLLDNCFANEANVAQLNFVAATQAILPDDHYCITPLKILCLVHCSHPEYSTRAVAFDFLMQSCPELSTANHVNLLHGTFHSSTLFTAFAMANVSLRSDVVAFIAHRIEKCNAKARSTLFDLLAAYYTHTPESSEFFYEVLPVMAFLTERYSAENGTQLAQLWTAILTSQNFSEAMRVLYKISDCATIQFGVASVYQANAAAKVRLGSWVWRLALDLLSAVKADIFSHEECDVCDIHQHTLVLLLYVLLPYAVPPSQDDLSIFMCPLLHACCLGLDHEQPRTAGYALRALTSLCSYQGSVGLADTLLRPLTGTTSSFRSYGEVFSKIVSAILGTVNKGVRELWVHEAMQWVTRSTSSHDVCRSLQLIRRMLPLEGPNALRAHPLSEVCNTLIKVQLAYYRARTKFFTAVSPEAWLTLRCVVESFDAVHNPKKLIVIPNVFWTCAAILLTEEAQCIEGALGVLNVFVRKLGQAQDGTRAAFGTSMPPEFEAMSRTVHGESFLHCLIPLSIRHLSSHQRDTLDLVAAINTVTGGIPLPAVLYVICAALPYILRNPTTLRTQFLSTFTTLCSTTYEPDPATDRATKRKLHDACAVGDVSAVLDVVQSAWLAQSAQEILSHARTTVASTTNPLLLMIRPQTLELVTALLSHSLSMHGPIMVSHALGPSVLVAWEQTLEAAFRGAEGRPLPLLAVLSELHGAAAGGGPLRSPPLGPSSNPAELSLRLIERVCHAAEPRTPPRSQQHKRTFSVSSPPLVQAPPVNLEGDMDSSFAEALTQVELLTEGDVYNNHAKGVTPLRDPYPLRRPHPFPSTCQRICPEVVLSVRTLTHASSGEDEIFVTVDVGRLLEWYEGHRGKGNSSPMTKDEVEAFSSLEAVVKEVLMGSSSGAVPGGGTVHPIFVGLDGHYTDDDELDDV